MDLADTGVDLEQTESDWPPGWGYQLELELLGSICVHVHWPRYPMNILAKSLSLARMGIYRISFDLLFDWRSAMSARSCSIVWYFAFRGFTLASPCIFPFCFIFFPTYTYMWAFCFHLWSYLQVLISHWYCPFSRRWSHRCSLSSELRKERLFTPQGVIHLYMRYLTYFATAEYLAEVWREWIAVVRCVFRCSTWTINKFNTYHQHGKMHRSWSFKSNSSWEVWDSKPGTQTERLIETQLTRKRGEWWKTRCPSSALTLISTVSRHSNTG